MNPRFTVDGSPALEGQLAALCDLVTERVRAQLAGPPMQAILLGGGYGRGEGGVWRQDGQERPYNDLDLYVLIAGPRGAEQRALGQLAAALSRAAGLEIELQLSSAQRLGRAAPSMFAYDLVVGHRWLWGDRAWSEHWSRHRDPTRLPRTEAWRLLVNRCTGLLLARQQDGDADFVGRNIAKAELALGDVVLTVAGQYHWSCRERHQRLRALPTAQGPACLEALRRLHGQGVEFKLHPRLLTDLPARYEQVRQLAREVWDWLGDLPAGHEAGWPERFRQWPRARARRQLRQELARLLWQRSVPDPSRVAAYLARWHRNR